MIVRMALPLPSIFPLNRSNALRRLVAAQAALHYGENTCGKFPRAAGERDEILARLMDQAGEEC